MTGSPAPQSPPLPLPRAAPRQAAHLPDEAVARQLRAPGVEAVRTARQFRPTVRPAWPRRPSRPRRRSCGPAAPSDRQPPPAPRSMPAPGAERATCRISCADRDELVLRRATSPATWRICVTGDRRAHSAATAAARSLRPAVARPGGSRCTSGTMRRSPPPRGLPSVPSASTWFAPQSENQSRPSCQRGDSPDTTPSIRTSAAPGRVRVPRDHRGRDCGRRGDGNRASPAWPGRPPAGSPPPRWPGMCCPGPSPGAFSATTAMSATGAARWASLRSAHSSRPPVPRLR
jgi:hypothetical protein